ncbi:MAG: DUF72 domain-containing protein [Fidelibacterota bacterium]
MSKLFLGTSGWSYDDWVGNFYPPELPKNKLLIHYSTVYNTVEIDSTFYAIPAKGVVKNWARMVPDGFHFSVKAPKVITHEKVLEDCEEDLNIFLDHMSLLGDKLGPILFQFSYGFKPGDKFDALQHFISNLPKGYDFALEVRSRKWLFDEFTNLLRTHNIALAQIDHPWFPKLEYPTADFAFVRWLGDRNKIESDFSHIRFDRTKDYEWWAEVIHDALPNLRKLYAYMNNHYAGHSPTSLDRFREIYEGHNASLAQDGEKVTKFLP